MHFSALFAPVASHCIPIRVTFPLHLLTSCERNWHELYVAISLSRAFSGWEIARFLQLARMRAFLCHHKISNARVGLFNFLRMTMRPGDKMSCYFRSPPENNVLCLLGCQLNICCLVSLKLLFFFLRFGYEELFCLSIHEAPRSRWLFAQRNKSCNAAPLNENNITSWIHQRLSEARRYIVIKA